MTALRIHPDARREFNDAVDYYERESPGLGSVFIDEVDAGFGRIQDHPDAAPQIAAGMRKLVLARFPYSIVYEIRSDFTRVLAVAHQRKRPFYWRGRR
jgi:plasmid stabilization system protein ParE